MILLSAFEPFGADDFNSSLEVLSAVVSQMERSDVVFVTLPVSFERCTSVLFEAIEFHRPTTVLCFGQAAGRGAITVETTAVNVACDVADNDGAVRFRSAIALDAPDELATTLPVDLLVNTAQAQGVDAQISNSAGEYVCNFLFYTVQLRLEDEEVSSGFIHLPITEKQREAHPDSDYMALDDQVLAVRAMIDALSSL